MAKKNKAPASGDYRQGDIYLERIEELPAGVKPAEPIVARGETTGHVHEVIGADTTVFCDSAGNLFVRVSGPDARLEHRDAAGNIATGPNELDLHATHPLAAGTYRLRPETVYSPEGAARAAD